MQLNNVDAAYVGDRCEMKLTKMLLVIVAEAKYTWFILRMVGVIEGTNDNRDFVTKRSNNQ